MLIIIFFISSTCEEHTMFDKYISNSKKDNSYIHVCTSLIIRPVLSNRRILLDNMNIFFFKTKTLTLLIV